MVNGMSAGRRTLPHARMTTAILAALAIFAAAAAAAAATAGSAAGDPTAVPGPGVSDPMSALVEPGDATRLSDEKKVTRWAHANETSAIRATASSRARTITRLRFLTEDKLPEVYLVLDGKLDAQGDAWLHIRIPMRPNGRTGWVPADELSQLYVVTTKLVIDRTAKRATLTKGGRKVWQAPVGIGKASTPTPRGTFWVRERLRGDGKAYGPWAFGTSAYSSISDWPNGGVVGIHGTNEPNLVPGRPSHGCVRLRNDKIRQLARLMPVGTPVSIVR
jgi:lipoprotein-anchoring transpeptidase ErfK/SrfK